MATSASPWIGMVSSRDDEGMPSAKERVQNHDTPLSTSLPNLSALVVDPAPSRWPLTT